MNIVEPVLFQCKLNPFAMAICVPGSKQGSVNYGTFERFIRNSALRAIKSGIVPGSIVATYINDSILHTSLTLGLMYIGAATLSLKGPRPVAGDQP